MSSSESQTPLFGEALLDAVTDAIVALHVREHGRFPATAETVMLGEDLLTCTLGGVHAGPDDDRAVSAAAGPGSPEASPHHTYIDVVQRLSGRTVLAFILDYDAGPDHWIELFWLAPPSDESGASSVNGHR